MTINPSHLMQIDIAMISLFGKGNFDLSVQSEAKEYELNLEIIARKIEHVIKFKYSDAYALEFINGYDNQEFENYLDMIDELESDYPDNDDDFKDMDIDDLRRKKEDLDDPEDDNWSYGGLRGSWTF